MPKVRIESRHDCYADEQRRVPLPDSAKRGKAFDLKEAGPSTFVLTRGEPRAGVQLQRKDGFLVAITPSIITQAGTRRAVDEFRERPTSRTAFQSTGPPLDYPP